MEKIVSVAEQFKASGKVTDVREYGKGNINATYLVTLDSPKDKYFILQRLNEHVFRQPEKVMLNMHTVIEHVSRRLVDFPLEEGRCWQIVRLLPTQDNRNWLEAQGSCWRAISFVEGAQSFDAIKNVKHGREVGWALGTFHSLLSDLPVYRLADTLRGFHDTPRYLRHYDEVVALSDFPKSPEVRYCLKFVSERRELAAFLENYGMQGGLKLRPIHGDPKVNNIMMDIKTGQAVSMVDLDTVKPGLVDYDIGDCLRSGCNPLGEEVDKWEAVRFETALCQAILQGYLAMADRFMTGNDYDFLYEAVRLIAFELGLRFFTDYLEGNVYFKAVNREHNLFRALVQFKLTESIESQKAAIGAIIRDLRRTAPVVTS